MAPVPQEHKDNQQIPTSNYSSDGETIVISGMSGLFPQSYHVKDLSEILYNKVNPVTEKNSRWKYDHPELPQQLGKVPDLRYFDAQFFKVHYRLGNNMDAMSRKLLEQTYQAVFDSGLSPEHLSGKKVGVYVGTCFSETEKASFYVASIRTGFGIAGCAKSMFANRISYWLNLKGPSMSIDAACASSMIALERAYEAIKSGECEAAIVGGANICLHPQSSLHYGRIMTLCMDGKTKSFDKNADGCARSDAISVIFLQKAKDAKRIYADVCYVKSEFGPTSCELGQKYGPYREQEKLTKFINNFYDVAGIPPSIVEYVEAFGSAIPDADKSELEAISRVFCKDRSKPLLLGSVMSNIGYSEAAAGISAITKVILGYHTGKIAANLHCENPRDDIDALRNGQMQVVTDHESFNRSYVALNNLSVTGVNVHLLMHGHYKPKDPSRYQSNIPYLVVVSGRQESGVKKILDDLKSRPIDPEEIALFHNIHEKNISGHLGRGFAILGTNEENKTVVLNEKTDYCDDAKRPLWFVYSGMGSQWASMGAQLMRIPIFAASIERCRKALEPKGIDIVNIITSPDKTMFDNILHSFVGIAAIQIGLTDILTELGIVPDKIIGHSVGELGCAYADGCFTAEEMILAAYSRGLVSVETSFIKGSMAAVGLGYNQIINMCPPEIEVACHNAAESSTISGPSDIMRKFVTSLTEKGIFAKEVPCSNIAYHSRYIKEAGPGLLKLLKEVIKTPKARSEKWLSTSVPEENWNEDSAKYSSAEYHTNNLLNPVLFEETSVHVPANAVLIEIAPHGLLQAILKRSLPASCIHIPLTRRGHTDNTLFLLEAFGKLYMQGYNPKLQAFYPAIEFPVSTGTPHLSHLVEWAHHEKWSLPLYVCARRRTAGATKFIVSVYDDESNFLKGNVHGDETLYPYSATLKCVWDTLAMSTGSVRESISVQFKNVHIYEQPRLYDDKLLTLHVQLNKGNGYFEVVVDHTKIATGYVYVMEKDALGHDFQSKDIESKIMNITQQDVYKIFHDKGMYYKGDFRSIKSISEDFSRAQVTWNGNWVTHIDSLVQINSLHKEYEGIVRPRFIRSLQIDLKKHQMFNEEIEDIFEANVDKIIGLTRCGGVTIEDVKFTEVPHIQTRPITLKALKFVPYFQLNHAEVHEVLDVFLQIVAENMNKEVIQVAAVDKDFLLDDLKHIMSKVPGVQIQLNVISLERLTSHEVQILKAADLVVVKNLTTIESNMCELLYKTVQQGIFVLTSEQPSAGAVPQTLCRTVASAATSRGRLVLARWRPSSITAASAAISVSGTSELPLLRSTRQNLRPDHRLVVLTRYPPPRGLKELVQEWRKESDRNKIYVAMINHKITKDQHLEQLPHFDLAFNVLDHGTWGGDFYVNSDEYLTDFEHCVSLRSRVPGDPDTLHWEEVQTPEPNAKAVTVHYAGLNMVDAKRAISQTYNFQSEKDDLGFGMDYSGLTDSGERVMGIIQNGSASTRVAANPLMMWPVPAHWSLEDAATVPLPYAHAIYCLAIKCTMIEGMNILVHGATGALGLAVISIALANKCEVFATVSDKKKKHFLKKVFPEIPDAHIGYSRNDSFKDMIYHLTGGKCCNIVISCLEGNLLNAAIQCSSLSGYILDTSSVASNVSFNFGMNHLTLERNYARVDFSSIFRTDNQAEMKKIQIMLSEGIAKGYVRPLSRVVYGALEAPRALRLLATSRHRGRNILHLRGTSVPVIPRLSLSKESSHLVLSATTDETIVTKMVELLIARGAKNILLQRQQMFLNNSDGFFNIKLKKWQNSVNIKISNENVLDLLKVQNLLEICNKMGPIEGVYLINTGPVSNRVQSELTNTINNIDQIIRKSYAQIKNFAIINEETDIGQEICFSRAFDRLPATMLKLPKLNKFGDENLNANCNNDIGFSPFAMVDAVEIAIRSTRPVFLAQPQQHKKLKLLDQISLISGLNINEFTPENTTFEQLGLDHEKSKNIYKVINTNVGTEFTPEDLPKLTIKRLRQMDNEPISKQDKVTGLHIPFSYIDTDELMGTHDLVFVPTIVQNDSIRQDEFNADETRLVLIPGMEGHYSKFFSLCERLKVSAVTLQPGLDKPNESIRDIAERLTKTMLKKVKPKKTFYILGYSFGVLIALEMAAILEEQGLQGLVYCVDASPDTFLRTMNSWLSEAGITNETELENNLIEHLYSLMIGSVSEKLSKKLLETKSWKEKVELGVRELLGRVPHSAQYTRSLMEMAKARIVQTRQYDSSNLRDNPLRSHLVVLRSNCQPLSVEPDLGLSGYSVRTPHVYNLEADHFNALEDLRCANIVNRHLDKSVHDVFKKSILCEKYLLNASTFMGDADENEDVTV